MVGSEGGQGDHAELSAAENVDDEHALAGMLRQQSRLLEKASDIASAVRRGGEGGDRGLCDCALGKDKGGGSDGELGRMGGTNGDCICSCSGCLEDERGG